MNPIRFAIFEIGGSSSCPLPSESQHDRRSTASIVLGAALSLALLIVSMRSAAADANQGSGVPDPFGDKWQFLLGAGVVNEPRYPGSRNDFNRGAPIVSVTYDRFFFGGVPGGGAPAGIGAYLVHTDQWTVGLNIGADGRKPRRESDAPILRGWGNIPAIARGGMFASYNMDWLSVRGSVSYGGHKEGVIAELGIEAKYHATQHLTLSIGPEVTWVSNQYAMTFFGIDAAQSELAGVAPYRAKGGINLVSGKASARYMLTENWSIAAFGSYGALQGDAANSPVTTDKKQREYGAFVIYRF
jgi:MipA family protein